MASPPSPDPDRPPALGGLTRSLRGTASAAGEAMCRIRSARPTRTGESVGLGGRKSENALSTGARDVVADFVLARSPSRHATPAEAYGWMNESVRIVVPGPRPIRPPDPEVLALSPYETARWLVSHISGQRRLPLDRLEKPGRISKLVFVCRPHTSRDWSGTTWSTCHSARVLLISICALS